MCLRLDFNCERLLINYNGTINHIHHLHSTRETLFLSVLRSAKEKNVFEVTSFDASRGLCLITSINTT